MDLRKDIEKTTTLPLENNDAKFYRLQGLSQAAKDKRMNERKVRKPPNLNIIEDSDKDSDDSMDIINNKVKPTFDEYEVSASIREVNGGRDLSNQGWEESFLRNLESMAKSKKEIPQSSSKHDNIKINQSETKNLNDKCIKQKNRLLRNAAIMGLVKIKKISLQDLTNFSNENSPRKENESEILRQLFKHKKKTFLTLRQHGTASNYSNDYVTDGDKYQVESVPLHEDPEIFVHPLQMGIDTKKFKDIDFTVARIGRRTKVTPSKYFLEATDDSFFDFVKKKK